MSKKKLPKSYPEGCSPVKVFTPEEIEQYVKENKPEPPSSQEVLNEKHRRNAIRPDTSHLTRWAP